jgi:hypothetical protein
MGETTGRARQDVAQARARLSTEVDELDLAVRSAVDIPAKIRRYPARVAALGGGAVFLAAGGPKRVATRVVRLVRRPKPGPVASLLPDEVQRIVEHVGGDAGDVRASLERGFADWLEQGRAGAKKRGKKGERRTGSDTFWHLFDTVSAPVASRAAKQFAERLFAAEPDRPRADAREGSGEESASR